MSVYGDVDRAARSHDAAINHIFGCGLKLAALSCRPDVDHDLAGRLGDVIEELDRAVSAVRHAALTALVASRHDTEPSGTPRSSEPKPIAGRLR